MSQFHRLFFVLVGLGAALWLSCRAAPLVGIHDPTHPPDSCPLCRTYDEVRDAVVWLEASGGSGTGTLVRPEGVIATNRHVVGGADRVGVRFSDGLRLAGSVVARSPPADLALVQIADLPRALRTIRLRESARLRPGEEVLVIGHPMGLGWSLARGIVSSVRDPADPVMPGMIQLDAGVSPGNSGGPVLSADGELVGVLASKLVAPGAEGLAFAVPVERLRELLEAHDRDKSSRDG
ncbi:MAG: serine protease [Planctomycetales bacterium]|nr:serine protease [Planctomycetales bacterium]